MSLGDEPWLTAEVMVEAYGYDVQMSHSVVVVYDQAVPLAVSGRRTGARRWGPRSNIGRQAKHPFRRFDSLREGVDLVLAAGPGAPVAAITAELLIALGARELVSVGTGGVLDANPRADADTRPRVVSRAVSDEGTSGHYGADLTATPSLVERLCRRLDAPAQVALTTDVPFRHTPARLREHRARADLVEMECAALFAAANHHGIASAAVLVPSDHFALDRWEPASPSPHREIVAVVDAVADELASGS